MCGNSNTCVGDCAEFQPPATYSTSCRLTQIATCLENWSRKEICSVIQFLRAKQVTAAEIHWQLIEIYGETVISHQHVAEWCRKFAAGRKKVTDEDRSGRPSTASTDLKTARVEELIQDNRRIMLQHMTVELGTSFRSVARPHTAQNAVEAALLGHHQTPSLQPRPRSK